MFAIIASPNSLHFSMFSAFHQNRSRSGGDSAFHAFDDQVCGFEPLHVAQQYLRHKDLSY